MKIETINKKRKTFFFIKLSRNVKDKDFMIKTVERK
jgi:hypothetical protein